MKKILCTAAVACMVFTMNSCGENDADFMRNETEQISSKQINTSELKLLLKNYNTNLKNNFSYADSTNKKKWWQVVGQVCAIATGDAVSAAGMVAVAQGAAGVVGMATAGAGWAVVSGGAAVVGAVGGSYAAYCGTGGHCRGSFSNVNSEGFSVVYDFPSEFDYLENIGIWHNEGLQTIYMDGNNINELDWANNNMPNIAESDFENIYNTNSFQEGVSQIKLISENYKNSGYDFNLFLDEFKKSDFINQNVHDILALYLEAIRMASSFEDYNEITQYYVTQVANSNLNSKEKESLFSAFSVSIQSFYYWLNMEVE
jgi:hypothetical protein